MVEPPWFDLNCFLESCSTHQRLNHSRGKLIWTRFGLTMRHLLDTTELLIASWILGGGDNQIPTSHGILDRALKAAVEDKTCPPWFRAQLHFVDSRIGLQCVELPALLDWAQRAQLTSAPNPSYQSTQVQISDKAARRNATGPRRHGGRKLLSGEHSFEKSLMR